MNSRHDPDWEEHYRHLSESEKVFSSVKKKRHIKLIQEAWADVNLYEIDVPEGFSPEKYVAMLNSHILTCTHPHFRVENGVAIMETRYSIGD